MATIAIFNLQYDDPVGSIITLRLIKLCQKIINSPVINDNRAICLLRKYRLEANSLREIMAGSGTESSDKYQQKMDELEKRIIDHDLNTIKQVDEKENVSSKLKIGRASCRERVSSPV